MDIELKVSREHVVNDWFSLENFYNAGVTTEQAKQIIKENVRGCNGIVTSTGLNGNWLVSSKHGITEDVEFSIWLDLRDLVENNKR